MWKRELVTWIWNSRIKQHRELSYGWLIKLWTILTDTHKMCIVRQEMSHRNLGDAKWVSYHLLHNKTSWKLGWEQQFIICHDFMCKLRFFCWFYLCSGLAEGYVQIGQPRWLGLSLHVVFHVRFLHKQQPHYTHFVGICNVFLIVVAHILIIISEPCIVILSPNVLYQHVFNMSATHSELCNEVK